MQLVTFTAPDGKKRAGALVGNNIVDLEAAAPLVFTDAVGLRWDMLSLLRSDQEIVNLDSAATILIAVVNAIGIDISAPDRSQHNGDRDQGLSGSLSIGGAEMIFPLNQVRQHAPLPRPASIRVFTAFEQHAAALYRRHGQALPAIWRRGPAFAFANHGAVIGPDAVAPTPPSDALDYGLALACVIGRGGRDIAIDEAHEHIAGYMIANHWAARDIQADEWPLGFGATKASDFAITLGPRLTTPDELEIYADEDGHLNLTMVARVNGVERSRGNSAGMNYTFARMIAYASQSALLYPGDVLSSGPVGGGCLLETTDGLGPWLAPGDEVELEITGLGSIRNQVGQP